MKKIISSILLCLCILLSGCIYIHADTAHITEFASLFYIPAIAVPTGSSAVYAREQLKEITVKAYTDTGEDLDLSVEWDFSKVNFNKTGAYTLTGYPALPSTYILSDNSSLPEYITSISVQNCGSPDINAYSCMKAAGLFVFPWLPLTDEDQIQVFLKRESSAWIDLVKSGYVFCDTDALYLVNSAMAPGNRYSLALSYKGQPTKILEFYYKSDRTLQLLTYGAGTVSDTLKSSTVIRSLEDVDMRTLKRYMAFAVPCNGSLDTISQELENITAGLLGSTATVYEDTAENPAHRLSLEWDYSSVNLTVPGVYTITGNLTAPEGYTLDAELELPQYTVYVSVQNPLQPEINTYYMPSRDFFCFPLCLDAFSPTRKAELKVWYKKDSGSFRLLPQDGGYISGNHFILERSFLQEGSSYELYISWSDSQTGIFSFQYDRSFITNDQWMERNYADREQRDIPDYIQEETQESVTDKWTVINGKRLNVLLENAGNTISFEKGGISTVLPVSLVKNWNIGEEETLQIFTQQDEDNISVHIYKGDQEITDIPGASIQLSSNTSDSEENVSVTDASGKDLSVSEDSGQKTISIATDQTGDFTVDQPHKRTADKTGILFVLLVIGIGTILKVTSGKRGD